ncbi:MAG: uroporphyrinogen decarboxylase family protein [Kiritimatiellota bacterium]|nr:uroporphyrinogen decarboxylase family protein [Kiritimatiellota bacterium]
MMTPRERVMAALNHQRPDRLPRYDIFFPSFSDAWRQSKGLADTADISEYYRIDIPAVRANQNGPLWRQAVTRETGGDVYYVRDSWGRLRKHLHSAAFFEVVETAIADKQALDRLAVSQPDDLPLAAVDDAFIRLAADPRFAPVTGVMGLYMAGTWLRGEIPFMLDLMEDEAFCRDLIGKMEVFLSALGERMLTLTNTWDTAIWVYDDFSVNAGPLIGPATFEKLFLEPYKRMFASWKSKGARHIVLHHDVLSEHTYPILDMFIEAGLTGIQGVYPTAGLTLSAFKARYGRKLAVIGGIDNTHTLPFGNRQAIEHEAAAVMEAGQDGGVIIGSHSIEEYIPVDHYEWYISTLDRIERSG